MSVQVSYKKQATLAIIGIAILLLAIEAIANVWWADGQIDDSSFVLGIQWLISNVNLKLPQSNIV